MIEEKIIKLKEKLDKSIIEGEKYEKTYNISIELDRLIANIIYVNSNRQITKTFKSSLQKYT